MNRLLLNILSSSVLYWVFAGTISAMEIKPVAFKDCSPLPAEVEFNVKPMFCNEHSSIAFMVFGENLVALKKGSLKIDKLSLNGKDISRDRLGEPAYELGSFPKVSKTGKYLTFELKIKSPVFGALQDVQLAGKVDLLTSERLIDKSTEAINLLEPFSLTMGPYTITNKPEEKAEDPSDEVAEAFNEAFSKGFSAMFGQTGDDGNTLPLRVVGDLEALVSLEILDGDAVTKSTSSWSDGKQNKTLNFARPAQAKTRLRLRYWSDVKQETVSFTH